MKPLTLIDLFIMKKEECNLCKEIIYWKKKVINNFWLIKLEKLEKKFIFDLFYNFNFFHVFLIKMLNIISFDESRNMHIF